MEITETIPLGKQVTPSCKEECALNQSCCIEVGLMLQRTCSPSGPIKFQKAVCNSAVFFYFPKIFKGGIYFTSSIP